MGKEISPGGPHGYDNRYRPSSRFGPVPTSKAVANRLQALLDRQDSGQPLSASERDEAEGLVNLAEFLTLLRLRAERIAQ